MSPAYEGVGGVAADIVVFQGAANMRRAQSTASWEGGRRPSRLSDGRHVCDHGGGLIEVTFTVSDTEAVNPGAARPSVFLSYASEDRAAARSLGDCLPTYGLEVWYDESELGGGDAWDQKIRRQIRECDYFMPLVSAQTNRRNEGYFRREWRLAVERTLDMADDHLFLLPVVIDDVDQSSARVPEKFLAVQWLRVPGGRPTAALEAMCRRIVAGGTAETATAAKSREMPRTAQQAAPDIPGAAVLAFPVAHEGQHVRFWVDVGAWFIRSAWLQFKRLPRWVRAVAYVWLGIALLSRCNDSPSRHVSVVTPAEVEKLKAISKKYEGVGAKDKDIAALGEQVAKAFADEEADEASDRAGTRSPLLAVAFTAPAGDEAAGKLADSAFAMAYGRAAISHRGQVQLSKEPLTTHDSAAAVKRAKKAHSKFVLFGAVEGVGSAQVLVVKIAKVADGSEVWSHSYPAAGTDPATIAADIDAHLPALDPG